MLGFRSVVTRVGLLAYLAACEDPNPTCGDLEQQAADLIRSNQSCSVDAECVAGPTLACFLPCGSVVHRETNIEELRSEGVYLSTEYQERGCGCPIADCADPSDYRPACRGGVCTSVAVE